MFPTAHTLAGLPADGELLRRYATDRDEAAFELLVRRHAGAVRRVCAAVAGDPHAAEDAAQATFLALARKADSLTETAFIAGWLCRVAYRAALKARPRRLAPLPADLPAAADPATERADLAAVVWHEVARLADRYHAPVVLCYLHGLSNAEAARWLGCPVGTVAGRLARARDTLRVRLARRGVAPAALAAVLAGSDAVPAEFIAAAVRAASGATTPAVAALTRQAVSALTAGKRRLVATCAAAMVGLAAALLAAASYADDPKPPAAKPADPPKGEKPPLKNEFVVTGVVLSGDGKSPLEGVEVRAHAGSGTLRITGKTTTDKEGKFRLTFTPGVLMAGGKVGLQSGIVSVRKPGWYGGSYGWPSKYILTDTPLTKAEMKEYPKSTNLTPGVPTELEFRMQPAAALKVRLLDADGKPMTKAKLWLTGACLPPGASVIGSGETDAAGVWTLTEVPRSRYQLVLGDPKDFHRELVLGSIDFADAAEYVADVTVYSWTETETHVKIKSARGKDLRP
jgi:RNA polymerase sigma factor (sigma-70 family)